MLTHLSLFSGIGGLDLAAEWAGFRTVGQCELADFPTKVLEKHWPDVPRWRDVRTLTKESFYERTGLRTVDVISGGFPCQPFSVAGKQKGKDDERYLWPEMFRVIRELTPRWVVGENVPGILRVAGGHIVQELEHSGYDVVVFSFEAAAVGAPHRRERVAFVANRHPTSLENTDCFGWVKQEVFCEQSRGAKSECTGKAFSDTESWWKSIYIKKRNEARRPCICGWWATEPDVGRVAHGVPNRVDRVKCLGNAVVPQQFYPIFDAIRVVDEPLPLL